MAEKKSQTIVRAKVEEIAAWKEAAKIRGLSLNQFVTEAANRSISSSGLDGFAKTSTIAATTGDITIASVLLAYDVALNQTPTLTGQRKWVEPTALREEFALLLGAKPSE
jgi:hypothetical protein